MYTKTTLSTSSVVLIGVLVSFIVLVTFIGAYVLYKLLLQDKFQAKRKVRRNKDERVSFGAHRIDYFPPRSGIPNGRYSGVIGPAYFVSTLSSFPGSEIEV